MKYIDIITSEGITQNVLATDLIFKSVSASTITIKNYSGNLVNASNLEDALDILDSVVGTSTGTSDESLDRTINSINDRTKVCEGVAALSHTFIHNFDSEFLKIDVWVEEDIGWQNSIVPITIVDSNKVRVDISLPKSVRIIVENINDVTKTYGL